MTKLQVGDIVRVMYDKSFSCNFKPMYGTIVTVDAFGTPWADLWFMWHEVKTERGTEHFREDMLEINDESRNTRS